VSTIRNSEFEIETNPWALKDDVESALFYRGAALSAWAQIESLLIELAFRASCDDAYRQIRGSYPYKLPNRLAYFRAVLDAPGPLSPYHALGRALIERWERAATMRHIMAHGRMRILSGPGPIATVTFVDIRPAGKGHGTMRETKLSLADMERGALKVTRFSRVLQRIIGRLDQGSLLPPLETES